MEELIRALTTIKEECWKHNSCFGCPLWVSRECINEWNPCDWDIGEIEKALAEMEKEK